MRSVVVVGASLAGLRSAESLRREGYDGRIVIVGDERHPPYDRPPLSKGFLSGLTDSEELHLRQSEELGAEWLLGQSVRRVDPGTTTLGLSDGSDLHYDGLVVATGAAPRRLPGVDLSLPGVHELRTYDDAVRLRHELSSGPEVLVVGGGFIGAELASTCRGLGLEVTVVTDLPLLANALGPLARAATERARNHGVRVVEPAFVTALTGDDRVGGVVLDDGTTLSADVVVVAVGATPRTAWLEGSGALLDGGVVCDETLAVQGLPNAVAAGDVARWPHPALGGGLLRVEHWTNAVEQGAAAARRLLRGSARAHAPVPSFWSDQFGLRLQGVGLPQLADEVTVVDGDPSGDQFLAEYRRRGQVVGAVVAGPAAAARLLPHRRDLNTRMCAPLV